MINAPKPRARDSRPTAADDVSITGSRRAPAGRVLQRSEDDSEAAELETFEQTPERGSEDARLLVDVPERTPRDEGA
jgi:hypothetical protein